VEWDSKLKKGSGPCYGADEGGLGFGKENQALWSG